jgi:hypothetical protein
MGTTSGEMLGEKILPAMVSGSQMRSATRRVRALCAARTGDAGDVRVSFRFADTDRFKRLRFRHQRARPRLPDDSRGAARRVLAGGYDVLSELVFAGFDCLRASTEGRGAAPSDANKGRACAR